MQLFFIIAFALAFGLVSLLYGYRVFLALLPIWGFFAGFWLGGDVVALIFGNGFLATTTGWIVGFFLGLVFAVFSYAYFNVAVAMIMATIGFGIASGLMNALGINFAFLDVIVGMVSAVFMFWLSLLGNFKASLVKFLTSLLGANTLVLALLLMLGKVTVAGLQADPDVIAPLLQDSGLWALIWIVIATLGYAYQLRASRNYHFEREDWVQSWG